MFSRGPEAIMMGVFIMHVFHISFSSLQGPADDAQADRDGGLGTSSSSRTMLGITSTS